MKEGKTEGKTDKQKEIQAIGIRNTSATLLCSQKSEANAPMSRSRGEVMCKSKMATFFHGALRALPATPGGPGGLGQVHLMTFTAPAKPPQNCFEGA